MNSYVPPPPGWYPDGGPLRWWDGRAWGPYAPAADGSAEPPRTDEERGRTLAVVSHLGFMAGSFILPLVLYLIEKDKRDRNRFVCHHACEALNFSITFMVAWFGGFVVMFATMFGTVWIGGENATPWPVAIVFPLMFVMMALNWVFGVLAMVRANQGVWWRYPVCIRFVGRGIDWRNA